MRHENDDLQQVYMDFSRREYKELINQVNNITTCTLSYRLLVLGHRNLIRLSQSPSETPGRGSIMK